MTLEKNNFTKKNSQHNKFNWLEKYQFKSFIKSSLIVNINTHLKLIIKIDDKFIFSIK